VAVAMDEHVSEPPREGGKEFRTKYGHYTFSGEFVAK
jgi:hypothetical protein